jgi:hypothetical protein
MLGRVKSGLFSLPRVKSGYLRFGHVSICYVG